MVNSDYVFGPPAKFQLSGLPYSAIRATFEVRAKRIREGGARKPTVHRGGSFSFQARPRARAAAGGLLPRRRSGQDHAPRAGGGAALIGEGMTNRQIGHALGLSEHTVANHVAKILKKLKLRSRAHIVARMAQQ